MLAEDEQSVRALTRSLLEEKGYTVLEASNGANALDVARKCSGPIHLLLPNLRYVGRAPDARLFSFAIKVSQRVILGYRLDETKAPPLLRKNGAPGP